MPTTRHTLFQSRDHRAVYAELTRLDELYRSLFRRNLTVRLFFCSEGPERSSIYSITVYVDSVEQESELKWLAEQSLQPVVPLLSSFLESSPTHL
jgi:hypothetical protein